MFHMYTTNNNRHHFHSEGTFTTFRSRLHINSTKRMIRISRRTSHNTMRIIRRNRPLIRIKRVNTSFNLNTIHRHGFRMIHIKRNMYSRPPIRNRNQVTRHRVPTKVRHTKQLHLYRVNSQQFYLRLLFSTFRNNFRNFTVSKLRRVATHLRLMTRRHRVNTKHSRSSHTIIILVTRRPHCIRSNNNVQRVLITRVAIRRRRIMATILPTFSRQFHIKRGIASHLRNVPTNNYTSIPTIRMFHTRNNSRFTFNEIVLSSNSTRIPSLLYHSYTSSIPTLLPDMPKRKGAKYHKTYISYRGDAFHTVQQVSAAGGAHSVQGKSFSHCTLVA